MNGQGERGLRPEEMVFLALLLMVLLIHTALGEPFYSATWFSEKWSAGLTFRVLLFGGTALVVAAAGALAAFGPAGARALQAIAGGTRDFLPFGLMVVAYEALHGLGPMIHGRLYDETLLNVDMRLFGTNVLTTVPVSLFRLQQVPQLTYVLAFCYSAVFVVNWAMAIYFFFCFSRPVFRRFMVTLALTSFAGYATYVLVPAVGPYEAFVRPGEFAGNAWPDIGASHVVAAFADSMRSFHFNKAPACDAFPSLHTAWAIIVLGFAWRHARWLMPALVPWAFGTVLATLFFHQHYVIDLLMAVPFAAAGAFAASRLVAVQATGSAHRLPA